MQLLRFRAFPADRAAMRLVALALASLLALAAACGGGGEEDGDGEATATATDTPAPTATPYALAPEPTIVSGPAATPTPEAATSEREYVVAPGDTLSGIAARFDSTVEAIMERNDLTDTVIRLDQTLVIPAAGATADAGGGGDVGESDAGDAGGGGEDADADERPGSHEVVAGDSAYAIAEQYDVTIEQLAAANATTVDALNNIQIGQTLLIP